MRHSDVRRAPPAPTTHDEPREPRWRQQLDDATRQRAMIQRKRADELVFGFLRECPARAPPAATQHFDGILFFFSMRKFRVLAAENRASSNPYIGRQPQHHTTSRHNQPCIRQPRHKNLIFLDDVHLLPPPCTEHHHCPSSPLHENCISRRTKTIHTQTAPSQPPYVIGSWGVGCVHYSRFRPPIIPSSVPWDTSPFVLFLRLTLSLIISFAVLVGHG